ncbi:MAG: adenylyltransferase, partial [Gammaproteobacteria bacterium]|nr:adenylyltransferase [Gammaproteobacteria bacterium]
MSVVTPFRKPSAPSKTKTSELIEPHGGELNWLYADESERASLDGFVKTAPRWSLSPRQLCDLELLLNGAFSPLTGFMNEADYQSVCQDMRLKNGLLWPMPIVLDVETNFAESINVGEKIVLCDAEGVPTAVLTIESKWKPSLRREAVQVYGSEDQNHPGVAHLLNKTYSVYIGGSVTGLQ